MSMTEYAKTSDNYLAHRLFRKNIYSVVLKDTNNAVNVSEIYILLFEHFAISKKFVGDMIKNYIEAEFLEYDDEDKTKVAITTKGLADIDAMEKRMRGQA